MRTATPILVEHRMAAVMQPVGIGEVGSREHGRIAAEPTRQI